MESCGSLHDLTIYNLTVDDLEESLRPLHPLLLDLKTIVTVSEVVVGEGNQSDTIRLGTLKNINKQVALKYISKRKLLSNQDAVNRLKNEIYALSTTHHPNIIGFFGFCYEPQYVVLIMEYAQYGDLFNYIVEHEMTDAEVATMFIDMVRAVEYLHLRGIVHRDIKPENFLIGDGHTVKLSDFGFCKDRLTELSTPCGSMTYAAPEILTLERSDTYTSAVDIWALGVCFYSMLTRDTLWPSRNDREIYKCILNRNMKSFPEHATDEAVDLFKKMCEYDPKKRITAYETLFHPFVQAFKLFPSRARGVTPSAILIPPKPSSIPNVRSPDIARRTISSSSSMSSKRPLAETRKSLSLSGKKLK